MDGRKTTGQTEGTSDDKDREVYNFDNAVAQEGFVVSFRAEQLYGLRFPCKTVSLQYFSERMALNSR